LVKVTVTYTFGNDDYTLDQKECTVFEALTEISRMAMANLIDIISLKSSSKQIVFTFYTTEKGGIYPFFYGIIRNPTKIKM